MIRAVRGLVRRAWRSRGFQVLVALLIACLLGLVVKSCEDSYDSVLTAFAADPPVAPGRADVLRTAQARQASDMAIAAVGRKAIIFLVILAVAAVLILLLLRYANLRLLVTSATTNVKDRRRIIVMGLSLPRNATPLTGPMPIDAETLRQETPDLDEIHLLLTKNEETGNRIVDDIRSMVCNPTRIEPCELLSVPVTELARDKPEIGKALSSLRRDCPEAYRFLQENPFLQNLRAIRYHLVPGHKGDDNLAVIVVPSRRSAPYFPAFANVVRMFCVQYGYNASVRHYTRRADRARAARGSDDPSAFQGVNYDDYDAIHETFEELFADLEEPDFELTEAADPAKITVAELLGPDRAGRGAMDRFVCVDITSGQRLFSVVATMASLNTRALFSYVSMGDEAERAIRVQVLDGRVDVVNPMSIGG